jgi:hypothetical protein
MNSRSLVASAYTVILEFNSIFETGDVFGLEDGFKAFAGSSWIYGGSNGVFNYQ